MLVGLVGPTCVGKTSVSIAVATALGAEIVSVDSRQIYREISIGTAKPSPQELAAVPHHFIDERSIDDPLTAAEYAETARERITEIQDRGKCVLLVGGATLYLHALLFGLDDVPPTDPDIRTSWQRRLESEGLPALREELRRVDPITHDKIDLTNPRRVLRALEVFATTGMPLSSYQTGMSSEPRARLLVLNRSREDLYRRINRRVESMIADGLIDEVKALLKSGYSSDLQALQTIGYREVVEHLGGVIDRHTMIGLIQRNTRRYAKRQLTWFRRYDACEWLSVREHDSSENLASRIISRVSS